MNSCLYRTTFRCSPEVPAVAASRSRWRDYLLHKSVRTTCVVSAYSVRSTWVLRAHWIAKLGKWRVSTDHALITCAFKRRTESVRCALVGSTGHARHTHSGESVARTQPERSESSSCTKSATVCLRAPKSVRRRYSSRTDTQILPTFLHVDSTHLQVRRDVTTALWLDILRIWSAADTLHCVVADYLQWRPSSLPCFRSHSAPLIFSWFSLSSRKSHSFCT